MTDKIPNQSVAYVRVEHNHGILELINARTYYKNGYRYIEGTVVGGGQTSRLFHATSYKAFDVLKRLSWCIGSSRLVKSEPGRYYVSAVFC